MLRSLPLWGMLLLCVSCGREKVTGPTREPVSSATPGAPSSAVATASASASAEVPAAPALAAKWKQTTGVLLRAESSKSALVLQVGDAKLVVDGVSATALGFADGERIRVSAPELGRDRVDCTDPGRCSVGLESGGEISLFDADAHQVAQLVARAFRASLVVGGASHAATLQVKAKNRDQALANVAAATGMRLGKQGAVHTLTRAELPKNAPKLGLSGPPADVSLVTAELSDVLRFFGNVTQTRFSGRPQGRITMVASGLASPELVDVAVAACAVSAKRDGKWVLVGDVGPSCLEPPAVVPRCAPSAERAAIRGLPCLSVEQLRIAATFVPKQPGALALLRGDGSERDTFVVREGDFLDQKETASARDGRPVEINWRVAKIRHDAVELEWQLPEEGIAKKTVVVRPR